MNYNSSKKAIVYFINSIIILLLSACLGSILLIIVYSLPVAPMRENVARGTQVYNLEGNFPELAAGYRSTKLDNDTDATMLANAVYPVSDILQDAFSVPMIGYENRSDRLYSLLDYVNHVKGATYVTTYPRYWHGYLIFLKPLLLLFDFSDIRVLNMTIQFLLIVLCIFQMAKTKHSQYIPAFFLLLIVWNPITISLSFQNSTCFYITIFAILYLLFTKKEIYAISLKLPYLFLLVGIVTVYFDFLTYPLVSLGIPLVIWLNETEKSLKQNLKTIIICSIFWGIGYVGMWIEKWILASCILRKNIFTDGLSQFLVRSSNEIEGTVFSKWDCITLQISVLLKWPYFLLFIGVLIFILLKNRKTLLIILKSKKECYFVISRFVPYLLLCLYPFIWYCVASNHCYINPKFTYRLLGFTIFAGFSGVIKCIQIEQSS